MAMLKLRTKAPGKRRPGTVAVLVAVSMIALLSMVALSLDGGTLLAERRHSQATSDSAALSAACDLYDKYWTNSGADPDGIAKTSALKTAFANGYKNDGTLSKVTVNIPPLSVPYQHLRSYAEVVVEYN